MSYIISQPYVMVERRIKDYKQQYIEVKEYLYLYETSVSSKTKQFHLHHIFDISYKPTDGRYGFLYLHTNQGVISYQVTEDPYSFIEAFRKLINK
ncbi:hypothetical protein ACFFGV_12770 [Pontibacillus salicampi]|uniref:Uncharacterized protein n=1 Tax=Pontibacillus salicampi TaxID=1449801 RepID=A0ABV6LPV6_9BACI